MGELLFESTALDEARVMKVYLLAKKVNIYAFTIPYFYSITKN
jgi:hypothetical protein